MRVQQTFALLLTIAGFTIPIEAHAAVIGWFNQDIVSSSEGSLSYPALARGSIAYTAAQSFVQGSNSYLPGVYVRELNGIQRTVAQVGMAIPGYPTSEVFTADAFHPSFGGGIQQTQPFIDKFGLGVSFLASAIGPSATPVVFSESQGPGTLGAVAIPGVTTITPGAGTLSGVGTPSIAILGTVFTGADAGGAGIFFAHDPGDQMTKLVGVGDAAPTTLPLSGGTFSGFGFGTFPTIDSNNITLGPSVAFLGFTNYVPGATGIYVKPFGESLGVVAERFMLLPGQTGAGGERYSQFNFSPSIDENVAVFYGEGLMGTKGIYTGSAGSLPQVVADTHTALPGGGGFFSGFGNYASIDNGYVAFEGFDSGGQPGIYTNYGGSLNKVFDFTDFKNLFPGENLVSISLFHEALSGNQVAFRVQGEVPGVNIHDSIILSTAVIPLPSSLLLVLAGLGSLSLYAHRWGDNEICRKIQQRMSGRTAQAARRVVVDFRSRQC